MDAWGKSFTAISKLSLGWNPCLWAPTAGGWWDTFSFLDIQSTRASKLSPNHMTSYWVQRHSSMCALLLLPQKVQFFFFWSSHAHWCLIVALPLSLLDWKWSKHGTKRKLMFILSRKSRKKCKKKLTFCWTERRKPQKGTKTPSLPWWVSPLFR